MLPVLGSGSPCDALQALQSFRGGIPLPPFCRLPSIRPSAWLSLLSQSCAEFRCSMSNAGPLVSGHSAWSAPSFAASDPGPSPAPPVPRRLSSSRAGSSHCRLRPQLVPLGGLSSAPVAGSVQCGLAAMLHQTPKDLPHLCSAGCPGAGRAHGCFTEWAGAAAGEPASGSAEAGAAAGSADWRWQCHT